MTKLIIAGSQRFAAGQFRFLTYDLANLARHALDVEPTAILTTREPGIGQHAYSYAKEGPHAIEEHVARTDEEGAAATRSRDRRMATEADAALVIHQGDCRGLINACKDMNVPVLSVDIRRL